MTSRYEQLSDSARWYIENFDEIDLADLCANKEASLARMRDRAEVAGVRAARAEAALTRVHHLADFIEAGAPWTRNNADLARRIRDAARVDDAEQPAAPGEWLRTGTRDLAIPAHDGGPTIRECAAHDRLWPIQKGGE